MCKIIICAIVILAIAGSAHCRQNAIKLVGYVYCDPCRVSFPTTLSRPIAGAEVELVCNDPDSGIETLRVTVKTNITGHYEIKTGERDKDSCEIRTVSTPNAKCNLPAAEIDSRKVDLSQEKEPGSEIRYCDPVAFRTHKTHPGCRKEIDKMNEGFNNDS